MTIEVSVKELDTGIVKLVQARNFTDTNKLLNSVVRGLYGRKYFARVNMETSGNSYARVMVVCNGSVYKNLYISW